MATIDGFVSCIMATADRPSLVPLAIRAFLNQTYAARELIVVDDGSQPLSGEILADARIRYIRVSEKCRIGKKHNLACREAKGQYICVWDDDDWSAPGRIEDQVRRLRSSGAMLTGYSSIWFWDMREELAYRFDAPNVPGQNLCGTSFFFHRVWWQRHPYQEGLVGGEDSHFLLAIAGRGRALVAAENGRDMMVARRHGGNTWQFRYTNPPWRTMPRESLPAGFLSDLAETSCAVESPKQAPALSVAAVKRIACIFCSNEWISWNHSFGAAAVLRRMGYDVLSVAVPDRDYGPSLPESRAAIAQLKGEKIDLAIALAADRISADWWRGLTCPVALWYVESAGRADEEFAPRYDAMARAGGAYSFYPALQDAIRWRGFWLPFGVDTEVFRPMPEVLKRYGVGFLGHLYGERAAFVQKLKALGVRIDNPHTAHVPWRRTEEHARAQAVELAGLFNACEVTLNLPAFSKLHVSRVTEAMACGVPFLSPKLSGDCWINSQMFDAGPAEYDPSDVAGLVKLLGNREYLKARAVAGIEEMRARHTLEARLSRLIAIVSRGSLP